MSKDLDEHIKHWSSNIPPPVEEPTKFNEIVSMNFRWTGKRNSTDIPIVGLVRWDSKIAGYYFQNMRLNHNEEKYEFSTDVFPTALCMAIRLCLGKECGITNIKGILDGEQASNRPSVTIQ